MRLLQEEADETRAGGTFRELGNGKKGQPGGETLQTAPSLGSFEKREAGQNKTKNESVMESRLPFCVKREGNTSAFSPRAL